MENNVRHTNDVVLKEQIITDFPWNYQFEHILCYTLRALVGRALYFRVFQNKPILFSKYNN